MTIHERFPFTWKESRKPKKEVMSESAYEKALNTDIGVLDLKTRSYNALKRASINTINDLIGVKDSLSRIRNVGANSVIEIQTKLLAYLKLVRDGEESKV